MDGELAYWAGLSGLTPAKDFSLADHQRAAGIKPPALRSYWTALSGLTPASQYSFAEHKRAVIAGGGGGGGWTPASLGAAVKMWYDADDASTFSFSSGNVISQWRDKSGNARHLAQGTVSAQPVRNGTINAKSTGVAFGGGDDVLIWNGTTVATNPLTIATVVKPISGEVNANLFDVSGAAGRVLLEANIGARWRMFAGGIFDYTTVPPVTNVPVSVVAEYNGASSKLRLNRAATATGDAGNNAFMDGNPLDFIVGRGQNVGTGMTMVLAELIVIQGVLSAPDLTSLETYLSTKWGTP